MLRTRSALTAVTALAAVLLLPAPAWAGDVQREDFRDASIEPWQVIGWGEDGPSATVRRGALTIGAETLVMLREEATPSEWTGSANRLTGFDVDFRMRLGADATGSCLDASGTPPTLLWVGDTTDLLHIGFSTTEVCLLYPFSSGDPVPLDTRRWHTYRLQVRGQHVRLVVDGRPLIDRTLTQTGGGTIGLGLETYRGSSTWDHVRYDTAPGRRCTIRGTDASEQLVGTQGADVICGRGGDDRLIGLGGDDVLIGGDGDDLLAGGPGHDLLQGGWGNDVLDGGPGGGRAEGGQGDDDFVTGSQPDGGYRLIGGPGHDVVDYGPRDGPVTVTLDGLSGDGAPGEDDAVGAPAPWDRSPDIEEVRGGSGDDVLTGSRWGDVLVGGIGADLLSGGDAPDVLDGVDGYEGNDVLDGGDAEDDCRADPLDTMTSCNDPDPWPTMPPPPPLPTGTPTPARPSGLLLSELPEVSSVG